MQEGLQKIQTKAYGTFQSGRCLCVAILVCVLKKETRETGFSAFTAKFQFLCKIVPVQMANQKELLGLHFYTKVKVLIGKSEREKPAAKAQQQGNCLRSMQKSGGQHYSNRCKQTTKWRHSFIAIQILSYLDFWTNQDILNCFGR